MNRPSVRLNDRKRVMLAAAMAAGFVLLAGGPNALANTIWCVTKTAVVPNPACTAATTSTTISGVLSLSPGPQPLDVIVVGPGYYNETVAITVLRLTVVGAQAGRDARVGRHNPASESIVDASGSPTGGGGGAAFLVNANNVVIDGFTIEGGTNGTTAYASGIFINNVAGTRILNNIIQNNALGVFIYESGPHLVEYNLFETNNAGAAGSSAHGLAGAAGLGIVAYESFGDVITENEFEGNLATAVGVVQSGAADITDNTSKNDGSFAVFYDSFDSSFSRNQGRDFGAQGFIPFPGTTHADAAVDVGYENTGIQINGNDLEEGMTPNYNGIAFTTIFGTNEAACSFCEVTNNKIRRFAGDGILAEANGVVGTILVCGISGNDVEDNGHDGIQLNSSIDNTLVDNEAEGNSVNDCEDDTPGGGGTAGTYNTWFNNIGTLSSPAGLCSPGAGHHHEQ